MRAFVVVSCQLMVAVCALRVSSQAAISRSKGPSSGTRSTEHYSYSTPISISTMFNQPLCLSMQLTLKERVDAVHEVRVELTCQVLVETCIVTSSCFIRDMPLILIEE